MMKSPADRLNGVNMNANLMQARRGLKQQRGVGMVTLALYFIVGGIVVLLGLKLTPFYIEYGTVKRVIADMAKSDEVKNGTVAEIRKSFERRSSVDDIKSIQANDLDISKENNETVVTAAWQAKVNLFTGYTLVVDFNVSTAGK
jgi:hypothetical protein